MGAPLLSILVPTFNYADGALRILRAALDGRPGDFEVIVGDDSSTGAVEAAIQPYVAYSGVKYLRNRPALGAPANWNRLLGSASGKYCVLMHHDEFPLSGSWAQCLASELAAAGSPDVLLLNCVLIDPVSGRNYSHLPMRLRAHVASRRRGYLFARNCVGPTGAVVARRSVYPRFDERLQWFVDVDLYFRLLVPGRRIAVAQVCNVGSVLNRAESISAMIRPHLDAIVGDEVAYLRNKYPEERVLEMLAATGSGARMRRLCEAVCWGCLRVVQKGWQAVTPSPLSPAMVRSCLGASGCHAEKR